tara:strand:+ start:2562 stop:3617 length:1056 start_codon:yes stop_codon:yes gene_type:complete
MGNLLDRDTVQFLFPNGYKDLGYNSPEEVVGGLNIFNDLGVDRCMFETNQEGFIIVSGKDFSEQIPSKNIVHTAFKLNSMSSFEGFSSFKDGFNNPSQFSATRFEVECSYFMNNFPEVTALSFAPDVQVDGSIKKPEFLCTGNNLKIYCECKSLESINRIKQSKVVRLMDAIAKSLDSVTKDENRIEIGFKSLPPHWNRNFGEQLAAGIQVLIDKNVKSKHIEMTIDGKYKTWIKLSNVSDPQYLKCTLNLGNKPRGEDPTLVIGEIPNLKKDIKSLIRDALSQLPPDSLSIIFIYALNETMSAEAIAEFFRDNDYKMLIGIMSWTSKQIFHQNPKCNTKVGDLLTLPTEQ